MQRSGKMKRKFVKFGSECNVDLYCIQKYKRDSRMAKTLAKQFAGESQTSFKHRFFEAI